MFKNEKGYGLVEGLLVMVTVLILGFGAHYVWGQSQNQNKESIETENVSTVSPDMDFVNPSGWKESIQYEGDRQITTYTAPDESDATIVLITQEGNTRKSGDNLIPESEPEEIKLESALFGKQYRANYEERLHIVTSFNLRVHFDVLMEENDYNQPKYQKIYQNFLDSFAPNGTTNNL